MPLNDSFLQELKYKTDIEDIISTYVTLKRRGATLVGLCPFHNEKTPHLQYIRKRSPFIVLAAEQAEMQLALSEKLKILIIWMRLNPLQKEQVCRCLRMDLTTVCPKDGAVCLKRTEQLQNFSIPAY